MLKKEFLAKINSQPSSLTRIYQILLFSTFLVSSRCLQINLISDVCSVNRWYIINPNNGNVCNTNCQSQSETLFGGYSYFTVSTALSKTLTLPAHYKLSLEGKFFGFDNDCCNGWFEIIHDNISLAQISYDSKENFCNTSYFSYPSIFQPQTFYHTSNSLTLFIYSNYDYWGIASLLLTVYECNGCNNCDNNGMCNSYQRYQELHLNPLSTMIEGWQYNGIMQKTPYNIFGTTFNGLQALYLSQSQIVKQFPIFINGFYSLSFKVIVSNVYSYSVSINVNKKQVLTQSASYVIAFSCSGGRLSVQEFQTPILFIKGNIEVVINFGWSSWCSGYSLIIGIRDFELLYQQQFLNECEDNNLIPFDGCFQNFYSCVEGCQDCLNGVCLRCNNGWVMKKETKKCYPICGDKIITYFEECDDGNQIPYDGCHQCKYSCPQFCKNCQFGKCLEWLSTYQEDYVQNIHLQLTQQIQNPYYEQCFYLYQQLKCYKKFNQFTSLYQICDSTYQMNERKLISQNKYFCGDKIVSCDEQCDDGNQIPYDGCHECKYSCILNCQVCIQGQCSKCIEPYQLFTNRCAIFQDQFQIKQSSQNIEGLYDQVQNQIELGYQQNLALNMKESQYKSYQQSKCQVDDYSIFGYFHDWCIIQIIPYCEEMNFQTCTKCEAGYNLDFFKNQCQPKCGDAIKQTYEECDDNNGFRQFHGCYNCQNSCQVQCLVCYNQKCLQCKTGWILDNDQCISRCGDGVVAEGSYEQCDDALANFSFGCKDCKIICSSNCVNCQSQDFCLTCEEYYELIDNRYCKPICGDKYVIEGFEDCDDGNNIEYDGCHNCIYSCRKGCEDCQYGQCIKMCAIEGYYYSEELQKCESDCGDGIIAKYDEQCDDKNDTEFDGCYQCLYSCDESICEQCYLGQCLKCKEGYLLNNGICVDTCGNGVKSSKEGCDDGNHFSQDGCSSSCEIEEDQFYCDISFSPTRCIKRPIIQLTFLNQTDDYQFVKLGFSRSVQLISKEKKFTDQLDYSIKNSSNLNYNIHLIVVSEINEKLSDPEYQFSIQYLSNVQQAPYLIVNLKPIQIFDEEDIQTAEHSQQIQLKTRVIIDQKQIQAAQNFQALGEILIIGLGVASFLILLSGNPSDCMEILDALQYQSYLKYINVQYPQNLDIYFESSNLVSVNPVLINLKIIDLLDFTIGQEIIQPIGKFINYDLNADLLSNIYGQFTQIGVSFFIFIFLLFYKRFFFKYCFTSNHFYAIRFYKSKLLELIAFIVYKINKLLFQFDKLVHLEGMTQLFLANTWDLTFKVFLYITSNQNNLNHSFRELISYTICIIFFIFVLLFISTHFRRFNKKIVLSKVRYHQHETIILVKRILFLFVLINLQQAPLYQSILTAFISIFYIGFIFTIKFVESNLESNIIYISEMPILIFTLSTLPYCPDFYNLTNNEQKLFLGFLQIGVLILGLSAPFIKYMYLFFGKLQSYLVKKCKQPTKPKIMTFNHLFSMPANKSKLQNLQSIILKPGYNINVQK